MQSIKYECGLFLEFLFRKYHEFQLNFTEVVEDSEMWLSIIDSPDSPFSDDQKSKCVGLSVGLVCAAFVDYCRRIGTVFSTHPGRFFLSVKSSASTRCTLRMEVCEEVLRMPDFMLGWTIVKIRDAFPHEIRNGAELGTFSADFFNFVFDVGREWVFHTMDIEGHNNTIKNLTKANSHIKLEATNHRTFIRKRVLRSIKDHCGDIGKKANKWSQIKDAIDRCRETAIEFNNSADEVLKDHTRYRTPAPISLSEFRWMGPPDEEDLVWASRYNKFFIKHMTIGLQQVIMFFSDSLHTPVAFLLCLTHYSCGMLLRAEVVEADLNKSEGPAGRIKLVTPLEYSVSPRSLAQFHSKVVGGAEYMAVRWDCTWCVSTEQWLEAIVSSPTQVFWMDGEGGGEFDDDDDDDDDDADGGHGGGGAPPTKKGKKGKKEAKPKKDDKGEKEEKKDKKKTNAAPKAGKTKVKMSKEEE